MKKADRLSRLKSLKVERGDGPLFKTANDCLEWIDNVTPLLKYDNDHYKQFMAHSQYARITTLSADTLMAHLNPMIGIVNQAIMELEHDIESPKTIPESAPNPPANNANTKHDWHNMPLGKIAVGVIVVILGSISVWAINHYLNLQL